MPTNTRCPSREGKNDVKTYSDTTTAATPTSPGVISIWHLSKGHYREAVSSLELEEQGQAVRHCKHHGPAWQGTENKRTVLHSCCPVEFPLLCLRLADSQSTLPFLSLPVWRRGSILDLSHSNILVAHNPVSQIHNQR